MTDTAQAIWTLHVAIRTGEMAAPVEVARAISSAAKRLFPVEHNRLNARVHSRLHPEIRAAWVRANPDKVRSYKAKWAVARPDYQQWPDPQARRDYEREWRANGDRERRLARKRATDAAYRERNRDRIRQAKRDSDARYREAHGDQRAAEKREKRRTGQWSMR